VSTEQVSLHPTSYNQLEYEIAGCSIEQTPAKHFRLELWPNRNCMQNAVKYCEWFDWSEVFAAGIEYILGAIAKTYRSEIISISGVLTDSSSQLLDEVRVIRIGAKQLEHAYFRAIWDAKSMFPSGQLAAAARMVLLWDSSQKWLVVSDRFYEIGLLATLDKPEQWIQGLSFTVWVSKCYWKDSPECFVSIRLLVFLSFRSGISPIDNGTGPLTGQV
jgi:hypothetical protein